MRLFTWLVRAFVFFALFAFALNNQQDAAIRWFFGHEWRAPMVFIVLAAFGLGCALGIAAMLPSWWKHRRQARLPASLSGESAAAAALGINDRLRPGDSQSSEHPPRDGL